MIRIIDMREATNGDKSFSIWDTCRDRFIEIEGYQDFDGESDFVSLCGDKIGEGFIGRVRLLLPKWARDTKENELAT